MIVLELVLVPAFRSWSPCRRCARVGTCVEVLVAVVLVLELCWYLRLGRVVGVGVPGLPPGDPKIAVRRFFTNLSCRAVAAGRDSLYGLHFSCFLPMASFCLHFPILDKVMF